MYQTSDGLTTIGLLAFAARCPGLTSLFLSDCRKLTDASLVAIAEHCPQLTSLSLHTTTEITGVGLKDFFETKRAVPATPSKL